MGAELLLLPVIIAFVDWGMPLPAEKVQEQVDTCISLELEAEPQWTNDYWPGIEKFNIKNYVRSVRCVERPEPEIELPMLPLITVEPV